MTRFPLRYAHENILVGHGDARAALFRVDTVSYPFLAAADKREWLRRLARFAFAVEADFSLYRVCRAYPADGYAERAMGLLDARRQSPAAWRSYLKGHEAHLRELRSFTPEVYLAVSLPPQRTAPGSIARAGGSRASSASRIRCRSRPRDRRPGRRRGAGVPPRRGVPAGPAGDDPRAAVAAAPRGVPRSRRAGAGRSLGAGGADRRDRRRAARPMSRSEPTSCATSTRRCSSRTARWSSTPRRAARIRRCSGSGRCPRSRSSRAAPSCCSRRWRRCRSRSTPSCTRAGSATARRSRACGGGSSTPTSPSASS